ncbi:MAG: hypothetical protein H6810_05165 [Phycisphaeraceae bacterium]|nr:MAG: hypothetical protein H6810_05165 [Phycisphaeraceae bacterium]
MRLLVAINRVCYGSCLLSIIAGAFVTVLAIWTEQQDAGWKGVSTAAVLIFAAILVLATNGVIGTKVMNDDGGIDAFRGHRPSRDATQPLAEVPHAKRMSARRADPPHEPPSDTPAN